MMKTADRMTDFML